MRFATVDIVVAHHVLNIEQKLFLRSGSFAEKTVTGLLPRKGLFCVKM